MRAGIGAVSEGAFIRFAEHAIGVSERAAAIQTLKWLHSTTWCDPWEPTEEQIQACIKAMREAPIEE